MDDKKTIVVRTTIVTEIKATWPDDYPNDAGDGFMTLDEALAYERDLDEQEHVQAGVESLEYNGPTSVETVVSYSD